MNVVPELTYLVRPCDMYRKDEIPVLILHVLKANIAENAGIVYENIYSAEILYRCVNYRLTVLDTVVIGDCFSAELLDFFNDSVGGL